MCAVHQHTRVFFFSKLFLTVCWSSVMYCSTTICRSSLLRVVYLTNSSFAWTVSDWYHPIVLSQSINKQLYHWQQWHHWMYGVVRASPWSQSSGRVAKVPLYTTKRNSMVKIPLQLEMGKTDPYCDTVHSVQVWLVIRLINLFTLWN
jgi:hypothetical protein